MCFLSLQQWCFFSCGRATCPKVGGGAFIALDEKWPLHTVSPVCRPVWPAWGPAWRADACLQGGRHGARLNRPGSRLAARTSRPVARLQPAWEPAALPSHPASSPVCAGLGTGYPAEPPGLEPGLAGLGAGHPGRRAPLRFPDNFLLFDYGVEPDAF